MKKSFHPTILFLGILLFGHLAAHAQQQQKDSLSRSGYLPAGIRLLTEGRISLFSECYYCESPLSPHARALYFRKEPDGEIQRLTYHNLRLAMADNPASVHQLKIAGTNLHLGIGLLAGGTALTVTGIIKTIQRNNDAYNAYKTASNNWFNSTLNNPNAPMPPNPPHYGPSPLIFIGAATMISSIIPLFSVRKHTLKALDIYNGIN